MASLYDRLLTLHTETVNPLIYDDRETITPQTLIAILQAEQATPQDLSNPDIQRLLSNIIILALSKEEVSKVNIFLQSL